MSTYVPGLHHFVLAKLATSSIRLKLIVEVNVSLRPSKGQLSSNSYTSSTKSKAHCGAQMHCNLAPCIGLAMVPFNEALDL